MQPVSSGSTLRNISYTPDTGSPHHKILEHISQFKNLTLCTTKDNMTSHHYRESGFPPGTLVNRAFYAGDRESVASALMTPRKAPAVKCRAARSHQV